MKIALQNRLPQTHRITSVVRETEHVTTITFPLSLAAKPGQFVMLWHPLAEEIPLSIAFDDGVGELRLTFFAIGKTTEKLARLRPGDLVGLRGPFGTSYRWEKSQRIALVAGGYGAAPMYFAASRASQDGCTLHVFVGARSKDHLLYIDQLKKLPKTTVHVATDDGSLGFKGFNVQDLASALDRTLTVDAIFACGPERMLKAVSDLAWERKIAAQLSLERYMKCGYGLCGNCTVDPLGIRLCVDGPVVSNEICRKIEEFGVYHRDSVGKKLAW